MSDRFSPLNGSCRPRAFEITVSDKVLHEIDPRLFGQFMERPSWGEIGPEAAVIPGTHQAAAGGQAIASPDADPDRAVSRWDRRGLYRLARHDRQRAGPRRRTADHDRPSG